jgi:hypothetical protein
MGFEVIDKIIDMDEQIQRKIAEEIKPRDPGTQLTSSLNV